MLSGFVLSHKLYIKMYKYKYKQPGSLDKLVWVKKTNKTELTEWANRTLLFNFVSGAGAE